MQPIIENIEWAGDELRDLIASEPFQTGEAAYATFSNAFSNRGDSAATSNFFHTWDQTEVWLVGLSMPAVDGFLFVEGWIWKTSLQIFNRSQIDFRRLAENQNDLSLYSVDCQIGITIDHTVHVVPNGSAKNDQIEIHVGYWGLSDCQIIDAPT